MPSPPDRPLRVVTMLDGLYGGAETMAREIAVNLDRARFEPVVCLTRREPDEIVAQVRPELEAAGVPLLTSDRTSRYALRPWVQIVRALRGRGVDILHTHMLGSNAWGALLAPLLGDPVFVPHEHTWSFEGQPLRRFIDRQIARRADAFVAVSEEDRRKMHEVEGIPLEKLRFVPNGIRKPPPGNGGAVRAELGIAATDPVIGAVATLRPQKALDVLLRAAALAAARFPEMHVILAGATPNLPEGAPDPARERLRALAVELGIGERVHLLGHRIDVPDVIAAFDIAVLSSDFEGSPLAVMEYMEAAKPVVSTRVGGVPDLIVDGVTGLMVEPRDPQALGDAVTRLLAEPERRREMGRAGRERRRSEFSIESTARHVEALYDELLEARRVGPARRLRRAPA